MRKEIKILFFLMLSALTGNTQTVLFSEDFGSSFNDFYPGSNWECKHSSASSYNTSTGPCGATGDYAYYLSGFNYYITTTEITLGASGNELSFDYAFDYSISKPQVLISTAASCGSTGTDITGGGLAQTSTCDNITFNLDAYANQTIRIVFIAKTSSENFYFDNVQVITGGGGGGDTECSDIFNEDFGTTYNSSHLYTNWCSASSYANSSSSACEGYSWYAYGSNDYVKTNTIDIPATGTSTLYFDYKFNQFSSYPVVSISTGGCYGSFTNLLTLQYKSSCYTESIDLSSYAGQSVNIRFYTYNSSGTFILDNVRVENCSSGGGITGSGLKWADTFNDNDTDLDFTGNDGDEDYAGATWNLVDGASIEYPGSYTVNRNETEAFNTGADASSGYAVLLDKNESLESPSVDLSDQESFKVSFYAMKQGGTVNWNSWTKLYLEYWDGSAWQTLQTIKNDATATDTENDYFLESSFGYHCFTVYKSSNSPGNYYYSSAPHVNSNCFHSDFKLRWRLDEFMSSDYPQVYIDNITFRADDDGQTVIPCGISYWNGPDATGYGHDAEATADDHSKRGLEVEIDSPYESGNPDWSNHYNDGNSGVNNTYAIMYAVVSEQKISTNDAKTTFILPDAKATESVSMSIDDNYTGPGYLYYTKVLADCSGNSAGTYDTGNGMTYYFLFQYSSDFRPVYYHLNSSGIEMHGGATETDEMMNPEICESTLPVELLNFNASCQDDHILVNWSTASEQNSDYYIILQSEDNIHFSPIAQIEAAGNSEQLSEYQYAVNEVSDKRMYLQLVQVDTNGKSRSYDVITVHCKKNKNFELNIFPNPSKNGTFNILSPTGTGKINVQVLSYDGRLIYQESMDLNRGITKIEPGINLKPGTYFISIRGEQVCEKRKLIVR
ncbi:MAG: T9SS type A sorting domain-containing protein [Bacteroidales bacterium]